MDVIFCYNIIKVYFTNTICQYINTCVTEYGFIKQKDKETCLCVICLLAYFIVILNILRNSE